MKGFAGIFVKLSICREASGLSCLASARDAKHCLPTDEVVGMRYHSSPSRVCPVKIMKPS